MATFSNRAANKVIDAVKRYNGTPRDNVAGDNPLAKTSRREFWAKITDSDTLDDNRHKYAWEAVKLDEDGFQDYDDENTVRKGELEPGDDGVARYAIDAEEWPDKPFDDPVADGKVVRIFLDYYLDDDGKPKPRYTFNSGGGPEAAGQYMGQVRMNVSNEQMGNVFPFAHGML